MSYYSELAASVAKSLRRDEATKQRLAARAARQGFALDGSASPEMSATEFATGLLAQLGLKAPSDPVTALDSYLAGREMGQRGGRGRLLSASGDDWSGAGMDSANPSFLDKYLGES